MKAVIMAGGEGTRLRPLTSNQPKPMIPMANRPMMDHVVRLLAAHGFDDLVVTLAFLPEAIRAYFGNGEEFGVRISYATEETPLGTAGSVRNAMEELDEPFLVISGDVVTDVNLSDVVAFHQAKSALATIALKSTQDPLEFGIVITRQDGSIERFLEKPSWGQVFSDTVNTGIYVLEPEVFDHIPEGRAVDFSSEVFPNLLDAGKALYGCAVEGYWEDVGTLEAYTRAHHDVLSGKVSLDVPGFRMRPGIWVGEGAEVDPSAVIDGPAVIGDNCRIGPNARIGSFSVLGSNVRVGQDVETERVVVHDNCFIGTGVSLRGCVVGRSVDLRRGVRCEEGVVLGDRCRIGADAFLAEGVKVYPAKTVDPGAVVNSSIVWETRGARHLFGRGGVSGLANVDITPEVAMRLSMAWAATLPRGATVTSSRDTSRAARVLKRAVMVGLNASGVDVADLEAASVPLTRFAVRTSGSDGGVSVRLSPEDPQSVVIRFFDGDGLDLDEAAQRKIERLLSREDFRRAIAPEIGDIEFPARTFEQYTAAMLSTVDLAAIRSARFKLVVDYAFGTASFATPNVLAKLGADVLAVNPFAATAPAMRFDRAAAVARVASLVRSSGAHLGVVIDPSGERAIWVDDNGRILSAEAQVLAALRLVLLCSEAPRVALPVSAPHTAEDLCAEAGAEIVWTKLSEANVLETASREGVSMAASADGGLVFPCFLPAFDALCALGQLLAMLAKTGLPLSKVADLSPPVHIVRRTVPTPWEHKGLVMRTMTEEAAELDPVLLEGVKVPAPDGWSLVFPDPEQPITQVWAEAADELTAVQRAESWAARVSDLVAGTAPRR